MRKLLFLGAWSLCLVAPAWADESEALSDEPLSVRPSTSLSQQSLELVERTVDGVEETLSTALEFLGIRYRRGGGAPETGFDCSGFVRYVFARTLGISLPHNARAISREGQAIAAKSDLQPGDLVFFNTMRRAFSHVGIYLGDGLFIHAPRAGGRVRIESLFDRYWSRRYDGARRIVASPVATAGRWR